MVSEIGPASELPVSALSISRLLSQEKPVHSLPLDNQRGQIFFCLAFWFGSDQFILKFIFKTFTKKKATSPLPMRFPLCYVWRIFREAKKGRNVVFQKPKIPRLKKSGHLSAWLQAGEIVSQKKPNGCGKHKLKIKWGNNHECKPKL